MNHLQAWAAEKKVSFKYKISNEDFVLSNSHVLSTQASLFSNSSDEEFDIVISNPPYFKIPKEDPRAVSCPSIVYGQPNIYSLFMGVAAGCLKPAGQFIFITPRSFAAGNYFQAFRQYLFSKISFQRFHLFESRMAAFDRDSVLQENIIHAIFSLVKFLFEFKIFLLLFGPCVPVIIIKQESFGITFSHISMKKFKDKPQRKKNNSKRRKRMQKLNNRLR